MNFLSHFYFDRHTSDPEQVLGGVMPDLVKNANKTWTIHPEKKPHLFKESEKMQSILTGWQKHLDIDRYFHNCDFFMEHTQEIRKMIVPILQDSEIRPSFLAHISLELMLDSLLVKLQEINAFDFYDQLANVERDSVKNFLELNQVTDTDKFFRFFDMFLEVNYLHSYNEADNLIYALNRICMRLWPQPMNKYQKFQLNTVLMDYQSNLEGSYKTIFMELDNHLIKAETIS